MVLCNGMVAKVPAIHDRLETCLGEPAKDERDMSNEGKRKAGYLYPQILRHLLDDPDCHSSHLGCQEPA